MFLGSPHEPFTGDLATLPPPTRLGGSASYCAVRGRVLAWEHSHTESRSSIVPNGGRTERREVGDIPTSSQCFDEKHTRIQPTPQDINGVSLVGELDRLCGDDLEIRVDPTLITIRKELKGFLR